MSAPFVTPEKEVGKVSHWFGHLGVMAVDLSQDVHLGDLLHIKGHSEDFTLIVDSLQIEHEPVLQALPGDSVGIRVNRKVHPGDTVYRVLS
jgi:hypothetical protein